MLAGWQWLKYWLRRSGGEAVIMTFHTFLCLEPCGHARAIGVRHAVKKCQSLVSVGFRFANTVLM